MRGCFIHDILGQFSGEIDVVCISEQLVELSLVGPVGSFDLSVQSRGSGLDVGVPHSKIFDMPMELSLKLVPVVSADRMNPEGELFHDIIDEIDGVPLIVAGINFQGPDPGGVVDGGVLEPLDRLSSRAKEFQELDVNLDVVPRCLFLVPLGRNSSDGTILREAVHPVAPEDLVDASRGYLGGVVTDQVPDDPLRPEMVFSPEMQNLLFDRDRNPAGEIASRPSFPIDQPRFTSDFEGFFPFIKRVAGAEV